MRANQTLGCEVAEAEIAEDDLGGVEEVEGAAVVTAEEQRLGLHVDVGGVGGERGDLVGEEDRRGVEVLAHAIPNHSSQLLYLFFPHSSGRTGRLGSESVRERERERFCGVFEFRRRETEIGENWRSEVEERKATIGNSGINMWAWLKLLLVRPIHLSEKSPFLGPSIFPK